MDEEVDRNRRRFLAAGAMTIAAAHAGVFSVLRAIGDGPGPLEAIGNATHWLNSPRLTPSTLSGKVVLVDFWTYTCINWLRTLPYLRAWTQKYRDALVLVGVHTPEFGFEQNLDNVGRAVRQMNIEYPVVIDNDYSIWRAFNNQYWPALYLIDARGRLRQHYFGEGEYDRAEKTIQQLVSENGGGRRDGVVTVSGTGVESAADWDNLRSPENYLGHARTAGFASPGGATRDRRFLYAAPARLALNQWALVGEWTMGREAIVHESRDGRVACRFHARDLHLVMGPRRPGHSIRFRVSLDGQPPGPAHGVDLDEAGNGTVTDQRLYQLIRQPRPIVERRFDIEFLDAGVEAFAFTFG